MTMLVVNVVLVFEPFLQLPMAADVVRGDLLAGFVELGGEIGVDVQARAAAAVLAKRLRMISWSIVGPITRPPCSGEFEGPLIR